MLKQKTVYFREEDLPLWEKIPNKAEWLHIHLQLNIPDSKIVSMEIDGKPWVGKRHDAFVNPKYTPPEQTA